MVEKRLDAWVLMLRAAQDLGTDEIKLLTVMAKRLQMGQDLYGTLKPRKKKWLIELLDELLDASVYLTAKLHYTGALKAVQNEARTQKVQSKRARKKV